MTPEERQIQIDLFAAGALPADEAADLRRHLATGELPGAAALAEATAAAALLAQALAPVAPPPSALGQLMQRVERAAVRSASSNAPLKITSDNDAENDDATDGLLYNSAPAVASRGAQSGGVGSGGSAWPFRFAIAAAVLLAAAAGVQYQLAKTRNTSTLATITQLNQDVEKLNNRLGQAVNDRIAAQLTARTEIARLEKESTARAADLVAVQTQLAKAQTDLQTSVAALAAGSTDVAKLQAEVARLAGGQQELTDRLARAESDAAAARALAAAVASPGVRLVQLAGGDPQLKARGHVLWDAKAAEWHVFVFDMAPPAAGKVFELWLLPPGAKPIAAGTFTVDANGTGTITAKLPPGVDKLDAAAISDEPAGGSAQPTGKIQLVGKITQ